MYARRLFDRYPGARKWTDDVTVIGPRLVLRGGVRAPGTIVVAGQVEGPVVSGELVRVVAGGLIRGEVRAACAVVEGTIEGPVFVTEVLEVRPGARLKGDVTAMRVAVGEGAQVRGKIRSISPVIRFTEQRGDARS